MELSCQRMMPCYWIPKETTKHSQIICEGKIMWCSPLWEPQRFANIVEHSCAAMVIWASQMGASLYVCSQAKTSKHSAKKTFSSSFPDFLLSLSLSLPLSSLSLSSLSLSLSLSLLFLCLFIFLFLSHLLICISYICFWKNSWTQYLQCWFCGLLLQLW